MEEVSETSKTLSKTITEEEVKSYTKGESISLIDERLTWYNDGVDNIKIEMTNVDNAKSCTYIFRKVDNNFQINPEVSNGKPENFKQTNENLTLVKKKITTHYIPPDMLAIKILFEIFRKEIDINDIENMSNEELINLKNKLISEISNEN